MPLHLLHFMLLPEFCHYSSMSQESSTMRCMSGHGKVLKIIQKEVHCEASVVRSCRSCNVGHGMKGNLVLNCRAWCQG